MTDPTVAGVLQDVIAERARQDALFGKQDRVSTPGGQGWTATAFGPFAADWPTFLSRPLLG